VTWEQPPDQPLADLGGALLLTHAGVDDQHRAGQDRDHPLQRRELPLRTGHILGGRAGLGVVPPSTGTSPARSSFLPNTRA
jgi:hypothetical protein